MGDHLSSSDKIADLAPIEYFPVDDLVEPVRNPIVALNKSLMA